MNHEKYVQRQRLRRRRHVRRRIRGTADRPRLTVFRSHKHVYCQVVDDDLGKTLVSASTRDKELSSGVKLRPANADAAKAIGKAVAEKALAAGISRVCFDRGHYKYHGRIAALADAAREAGLGL